MVADPNKRTVLFVDDRAKRIDWAIRQYYSTNNLIIAPNVPEALRAISSVQWKLDDLISMDHDLNGSDFQSAEEKTCGMEIIRHLGESDYWRVLRDKSIQVVIHSSNEMGAIHMQNTLRMFGMPSMLRPINYEES